MISVYRIYIGGILWYNIIKDYLLKILPDKNILTGLKQFNVKIKNFLINIINKNENIKHRRQTG